MKLQNKQLKMLNGIEPMTLLRIVAAPWKMIRNSVLTMLDPDSVRGSESVFAARLRPGAETRGQCHIGAMARHREAGRQEPGPGLGARLASTWGRQGTPVGGARRTGAAWASLYKKGSSSSSFKSSKLSDSDSPNIGPDQHQR